MTKKNTKPVKPSSAAPFDRALAIFLAGLAAEAYLILIYNLFINANASSFYPMYYTLTVLQYAGLAALAAGIVLLLLKKCPKLALWLSGGGAFFAVASFCGLRYWGVVSALCVLVPVAVVYVLVFFLFQRDFFFETLILGGSIFSMWVCRKGIGTENWNTPVSIGVFVVMLLLAGFVQLVTMAQKEDGMLTVRGHHIRLLPSHTAYGLLYGCVVLSVASLVIGIAKVAWTYYATWVLAIALFLLAVYYTIKQM